MYNPMISKEELGKSIVFDLYANSLGEREGVPFLELLLSPTLPVTSRMRAFFYFGELKAITKVLRAWDLIDKKHVVKDHEEALRHYFTLSLLISEVSSQSVSEVSDSIKVPEDLKESILGSFECLFIENLNLSVYNTIIAAVFGGKMPLKHRLN